MKHNLLKTKRGFTGAYKLCLPVLFCLAMQVRGQQIPVYSAYFFNKYLVNPAFAGIDNEYRAFGFYRSQWSDIPGRPVTGGATAEASFWKDQIGIGGYVVNDQIGIFNSINADLSYAQKIKIAKDHQLSVGLQGGVFINRINFAEATLAQLNDPGIAQMSPQKTVFDMSAGIGYKWKELLLGVGMTNILQPLASYASPGLESNFQYLRHYTAFGQYKIKLLNGKFNITPQLFMRKGPATGYQFDATVMLDYKNIVFLGGGYRNPFGVISMVGVNVFNMFTIAYAFDYTTNPALVGYVGTTSEITAGFHLSTSKAKKHYEAPPTVSRDSFMLMKKQADKLAAKVDSAKKALDKSAKQIKTLNERNDSLQKQNEKYRKLADSLSQKIEQLLGLKSLSGEKNLTENSYRLDKIYFDYKKDDLLPASEQQLNAFVSFLNRFPNVRILIKGYTDNIGSERYNSQLSLNRAKAVASYLVEHGINGNRIEHQGKGSANPVADNGTEEGRKLNRRVEFVIEEQ